VREPHVGAHEQRVAGLHRRHAERAGLRVGDRVLAAMIFSQSVIGRAAS
jgi:hypothetical protein